MKWIFLMLVSVAAASAQTNPLVDERIPIQPILLPDIPSVEIVVPHGKPSEVRTETTTESGIDEEGSPVQNKTEIVWQRKKEGDGTLVLRAEQSALVKVIDMDTRRLECLLWIDSNGSIELRALPESHYGVIFCQDIRRLADGRLVIGWIGAVDGEIDLTRARARVAVHLGVNSTTRRILPASSEEWRRFNPPGSAY